MNASPYPELPDAPPATCSRCLVNATVTITLTLTSSTMLHSKRKLVSISTVSYLMTCRDICKIGSHASV